MIMDKEKPLVKCSKKSWKNKNFIGSVKCTLNGIFYAICSEKNIKIQLCFAIAAIIFGFVFDINLTEWCSIVIVISMVLSAELFNTAIEKTVDLCTEEYRELAKLAKDISSGAVLIMAIASIMIGMIIFFPKIINAINSLMKI